MLISGVNVSSSLSSSLSAAVFHSSKLTLLWMCEAYLSHFLESSSNVTANYREGFLEMTDDRQTSVNLDNQ